MENIVPGPERTSVLGRLEDAASVIVLLLMAGLALVEAVARTWLGGGIPGSIVVVQHLTLWITILGAALAARSDRLLALSTQSLLPAWILPGIRIFTSGLAAGVTACLLLASLDLVRIEREAGELVAWGIPVWVALAIMPVGLALIAGRLISGAAKNLRGRMLAALGLLIPVAFELFPFLEKPDLLFPALLVIVVGTALGLPIYAAIGGAALLLFWYDGTPITAIPNETYRLTVNPLLPTIPLFALGGYILAEGGASRRLMRLFTAFFGWMPGGLAIVTTLVLAFFTPLTGASGVTILSMGGLFLPVLTRARYPERTSVGLVTVSGSIGLLFPPSLPVILYAFYVNQPLERLFIGGFLPGILLVSVVAGWGAYQGWSHGAPRSKFQPREAASAVREARWELFLPFLILIAFLSGVVASLVEVAALVVAYALLVECLVYKDLDIFRDLPRIFGECAGLVGGFMIILCVALGFTEFLILAEVPTQALDWVQTHIDSPWLFLLALNLFLIIVGALMDIYSAVIVVVPLIAPMAAVYGIDPTHLGIIFLANMELGYLMPPMGENLFLASYRFDQSLTKVYRSTLPYVVILLIAVLLITYVPSLTLWLVGWWEGPAGVFEQDVAFRVAGKMV